MAPGGELSDALGLAPGRLRGLLYGGGENERAEVLSTDADLERLLPGVAAQLDTPASFAGGLALRPSAPATARVAVPTAEAARRELEEHNATLYVTGIEQRIPALKRVAERAAGELGLGAEAEGLCCQWEAFLSPAGARTSYHWDQWHVLSFQLRGRKRWRCAPRSRAEPGLRHAPYHFAYPLGARPKAGLWAFVHPESVFVTEDDLGAESEEWVLGENAAQYTPPGSVHYVTSLDDGALTVCLNVRLEPVARAVCRALEHRLLVSSPEFRAEASATPAGTAERVAGLGAELRAALGCLDLERIGPTPALRSLGAAPQPLPWDAVVREVRVACARRRPPAELRRCAYHALVLAPDADNPGAWELTVSHALSRGHSARLSHVPHLLVPLARWLSVRPPGPVGRHDAWDAAAGAPARLVGQLLRLLSELGFLADGPGDLHADPLERENAELRARVAELEARLAGRPAEPLRPSQAVAYVVHLARRADREPHIARARAALEPHGVDVRMAEACDGAAESPESLSRRGLTAFAGWRVDGSPNPWWCRDVTPGEIGCAASHLEVWRLAASSPCDVTLVLEDDVHVPDDAWPRLAAEVERLSRVPYEWDLIYLGRRGVGDDGDRVTAETVEAGFSYGTYAYALSRAGARKLAGSRFEEALLPVDEFLSALVSTHPRADVAELAASRPRLRALAWADLLAAGIEENARQELLVWHHPTSVVGTDVAQPEQVLAHDVHVV